MEKVFVTGADGMLGSSICRELLKQGYLVRALCLNQRHNANIDHLPLEIVFGDVLEKEILAREMRGCDMVIHVAALTSVWPRRSEKVNAVNLSGTRNVMEVAAAIGIKKMIHIGSAGSFGHGNIGDPGNEEREFKGWEYGMDYIESKYRAQKMLLNEFKRSGFPVVIINPTFMIGPYDSGPSSGKMLLGFYNNDIPGYSGGGKNFVYSGDVAVAAVNALRLGRIGECYIAGNENLSFKGFLSIAAEVMNKKFGLKQIPHGLILAAGGINSVFARLVRRPPAMSYGMARMAKVHQYFSSEKAVRELQMPQTPIREGIGQCMDWFKTNGYIKMRTFFENKVVLITGASMGIGKEIARQVLLQGGKVVLTGRNVSRLEAVQQELENGGENILIHPGDVSDHDNNLQLMENILQRFGRLDVLINNAGQSCFGEVGTMQAGVARQIIDTNIYGSLFPAMAALPELKKTKGTILFISSIAGFYGLPGYSAYSLSKMAVKSLAQSMRVELKDSGVNVCISFVGFTENENEKRTLSPSGNLVEVEKRPRLLTSTRKYTALRLLKQIRKNKKTDTHTFLGFFTEMLSSYFPSLTGFIFQMNYNRVRMQNSI